MLFVAVDVKSDNHAPIPIPDQCWHGPSLSWYLITQQARPSSPPSKAKSNQSNHTQPSRAKATRTPISRTTSLILHPLFPPQDVRPPRTNLSYVQALLRPPRFFIHENSKRPPRPSQHWLSPLPSSLNDTNHHHYHRPPLLSFSYQKKRVYLVSQPTTTAVDKAKQANKLVSSRI